MSRVVIIDDDKEICLLMRTFLTKKGFDTKEFNTGKAAESWLKKNQADLVLCDFKLPDYDGLEMIQKIKIINPALPIIVITGYSDVRIAVEALKKGAFEYVTKPLYPDEILISIQKALEAKQAAPTKETGKNTGKPKVKFITGKSPNSITVQKHIALIAPTDMSVIVLGQTGTGKEYVARAIHHKSERARKPFVAVDCGALPKDLAGSELFGHIKGAFTGALNDKKGCFEMANGGTLFLDEIGNLTYDNQVKLLRTLQERVVKPIGSNENRPIDVRIIVATNEDLKKSVKNGSFREDIYHRLNEFKIELSPLRERKEDIEVFAKHFLKESNLQLKKSITGFDKSAKTTLNKHGWSGNLRELKNVVKRAVLLCDSDQIDEKHLPAEIRFDSAESTQEIEILIEGNQVMSLKKVTEAAERMAIINALKFTNNNRSKTAEILEIDRKTLYNKLKAYKL